ncbi:branched-chain amino acid transport system substrate-binding protein [Sphaerotilus sulfidivorans]|uniref:ABC transporter substrate-binding protein n=1 Tax=Sphaerotilus sulfidivorans TaxID=639200 RepID=A0A5C1PXD5_9BURK|nr:ABC transporter substrate-binding protein [Sphaerotilus sulfidivorans]NZD47430.1 ABC transporter substrate-binding protein [Sphaerotilus sulfidivorans]QEM99870.1 ABC transporter substrate-binding protein [Sphaerotilus sulfidivorans]
MTTHKTQETQENASKPLLKTLLASAALWAVSGAAMADITIGVSLPLTGPASGLGIPMGNAIKLWPTSIAGEKLNVIVLDDATDPTKGVQNAQRFVTQDKADIVMGSAATPVAIAMSDTVAAASTPHFMFSPAVLQAGKDAWAFRLPQSNAVMSHALLTHMKKLGVKSVGFLGYTDAYGESWLKDFQAEAAKIAPEIKVVATERFARSDTSVTAQALKLVAANPDAMLIVASGSGAAMPHKAVVERGYKGRIYQTHAAATRDLMRIGGKDVEGAYVVSGTAVIGEQLPDSHPSKKVALDFVQKYEKAHGAGSRNQFAGHAYDAALVLEKVVPVALKKGKPGTPEFRAALKDAVETMGRTVVSHGVLTYAKDNHWGFTTETGVILKVVNGDWKVE